MIRERMGSGTVDRQDVDPFIQISWYEGSLVLEEKIATFAQHL